MLVLVQIENPTTIPPACNLRWMISITRPHLAGDEASKTATMKGISNLLDSDMEESPSFIDENSLLSSDSETATAPATKPSTTQGKKGKKRERVTMPKSKSRIQKNSPPAARKTAAKKTATTKRKALEEHVNGQVSAGVNDLDESETDTEQPAAKPKRKGAAPSKRQATKKAAQREDLEDDQTEDADQTPVAVARSRHAAERAQKNTTKVGRKPAATSKSKATKPSAPSAIPESPPEPTTLVDDDKMEDIIPTDTEPLAAQPKKTTREPSRVRQESKLFRHRAGSASDPERDPNLRRKLGDMTRRFESIDLKYRNLKEVGINEANSNVEKLRKQCDAAVQASNELVASLKKELATQSPLAQEARRLKKQVQNQEAEAIKLRETTAELSAALTTAQNEIKTLQAKLAAAQTSSSSTMEKSHRRTPGSAIKPDGRSRAMMVGGAEIAQAAQTAQLKEDLYSDLTGLIVRSAKRTDDGDTYDCIQTGRNGSKCLSHCSDQS